MDPEFLIERLEIFMESRTLLLDDGQKRIRLSTKELQAINILILFLNKPVKQMLLINQPLFLKTMCIVEFHLVNKKMILIDKSNSYLINTLIIKLLKTLVQDLIIKDQGYLNYWKNLTKDVSNKSRLCRFGFELVEWLFLQNNTELVVLEHIDKTPEQEFTEDILSILQVFACRWNGKRKYSNKIKQDQIETNVTSEETINNME